MLSTRIADLESAWFTCVSRTWSRAVSSRVSSTFQEGSAHTLLLRQLPGLLGSTALPFSDSLVVIRNVWFTRMDRLGPARAKDC